MVSSVKPNFHVQFLGRAGFFGGILGKKSRPLSNLLFIAGRKFLSKLGQHLVGLVFFGRVGSGSLGWMAHN